MLLFMNLDQLRRIHPCQFLMEPCPKVAQIGWSSTGYDVVKEISSDVFVALLYGALDQRLQRANGLTAENSRIEHYLSTIVGYLSDVQPVAIRQGEPILLVFVQILRLWVLSVIILFFVLRYKNLGLDFIESLWVCMMVEFDIFVFMYSLD